MSPYALTLTVEPPKRKQVAEPRVRVARGRRLLTTRAVFVAVGVVVSAAFMYVAARDAHPRQTLYGLRATDVALLVPALALLVLAFLIRVIRWQSLFAAGTRPPLRHVGAALLVGYVANALLPVRAGEAAAVVSLNRRAGTPVAENAATMLVQRAQDVLSLVLLLFVMLPWLPHVSWLRAAGLIALALILALGATTVIILRYGERPLRVALKLLRWLPVPSEAIERAPGHFVRGLAALRSPRVAAVSFGWTTLSWIVLGAAFWLVMEASALDLSPLAGELVVIAIGLAMILPSSPAALGVFEGATVVALSAYGAAGSQALSYALVLHALNLLPLFAAGAGMVVVRKLGRRVPSTDLVPTQVSGQAVTLSGGRSVKGKGRLGA